MGFLTVAVGSKNPVKVNAAQSAFAEVWANLDVRAVGSDVPSGVSAQPMSDPETIQGALNRAKAALRANDKAAYGTGIEGGLHEIDGHWYDTCWVVVVNRAGKVGQGQSLRIPVPDAVVAKIRAGKELGEVIDEVFDSENLKQAEGYIGKVTHGLIDRTQMCREAVVAALIPFANPDLFS